MTDPEIIRELAFEAVPFCEARAALVREAAHAARRDGRAALAQEDWARADTDDRGTAP